MEDLHYAEGYKYAHDFEGHFVDQLFLPEKLSGKLYYEPTEQGREKTLKERLEALWPKRRRSSPH